MIKNIEITNFKGIQDAVHIEFKPISLLFGPNSAGKSSIVQALHYAREIFLRRNYDPAHTMTGGSAIDLGKYSTLVHNHDTDKEVIIKLNLNLNGIDLPGAQEIEDDEDLIPEKGNTIEEPHMVREFSFDAFSFFSDSASVAVTIGFNNSLEYARATKAEFFINDKPFSVIELDDTNPRDIHSYYSKVNIDNPALKELIGDETLEKTFADILADENLKKTRYKLPFLVTLENEKYQIENVNTFENNKIDYDSKEDLLSFLKFIGKINTSILKLVRDELENFSYLGPIREIPRRNYVPVYPIEKSRWNNGLAAWDEVYIDSAPLKDINYWLYKLNIGYSIERKTYREVEINDLKNSISEAINLNSIYEEIANAFDNTKDSENTDKLFSQIFDILKKLDRPEILERISHLQKKRKVYLKDNNGVEVLPMDIGVGVSQVFPVVVSALLQKNSILAIEQPELHIHPAVQVELADLFIQRIAETSDVSFLLETHSEHLILRMLRRIKETSENKNIEYKLSPDDLNVYWCQPGKEGLEIELLPVDKTGEFIKRWPQGFFDERAEELFPDE